MKKVLLATALLFIGIVGYGQQDPQFTHFMFDRLSINPGVAGIGNQICATAIYRQQWSGFDGAPQTFLFNAHGPVNALHGGLGLTVFNDQLGFENNTLARLAYSYHTTLGGPGTLGIGVSGGMVSKSISGTWIAPDGTNGATDVVIPQGGTSQATYDLGFGVYYKTPDLYVGLSTTHITETDLKDVNVDMARHYYVIGGYNYRINGDFTLKPGVFVKSDAASTQIDLNVSVLYNNMVWLGVTYRMADAIAPMLGYQHDFGQSMLKIGYSYDVTTSQLKNYSSGSHEIMVNYCFTLEKPDRIQKYKNVRFL